MKHFTIDELTRSTVARIKHIDNTPPAEAVANLTALVDNILDPLRWAWGRPIAVTSGYRCHALNRAVGGSPTSHHLRGMAADITTGSNADNRRLFQMAIDLGLPFCQLIDERGFSWVHISYDPANVKRQVLKL
ncbi:MAG: peptidase M15 [Muribaculaceae bacterium]|nr:peptidase M15 [Muribaculaceae bacterium]